MPKKHTWASHITQKVYTGGVIASSHAEASGSAQGKWFQKPRHTLLEVFSTCFEKEDYEIRREEENLAKVAMEATRGVQSDPPLVVECRRNYSAYATSLVLAEVVESSNYTAFIEGKIGTYYFLIFSPTPHKRESERKRMRD